jgi:ketosteroid isomerase-like protein
MRAITCGIALLFTACLVAAAQDSDLSPSQSKIIALENAWNQAEEHKDVKALEALLDSSLVYIDYDGVMMSRAEFIASAKAPSLLPEKIVNESMTAHVYGDSAVVTGIYREKGVKNGKPYLHRGRFTDTWVRHDQTWVCVASQSTLIMH